MRCNAYTYDIAAKQCICSVAIQLVTNKMHSKSFVNSYENEQNKIDVLRISYEEGFSRVSFANKYIRPKQNICLFPICCQFNQWVGRKFILFFILFFVTATNR